MSLKQFARLTLPLLIPGLMLISGCATAPSEPPPARAACSTVLPYTSGDMAQALLERRTLPPNGVVEAKMLPDYERLRDEARACAGATK